MLLHSSYPHCHKVPLIAASIVKDNSNSNFLQSEDERSSHTIDMTGDDDSSSTDDLKIMKRRRRLARALHEFNLHAKEDHRSEVMPLTPIYRSYNFCPPYCFHTLH